LYWLQYKPNDLQLQINISVRTSEGWRS